MMNRPEIRNFFSAIIALIVAMVGQAFVRAEITLSQATVWFLGCAFAFGVFWVPSPIRRAVLRVIYVAVPILVAISLFGFWLVCDISDPRNQRGNKPRCEKTRYVDCYSIRDHHFG